MKTINFKNRNRNIRFWKILSRSGAVIVSVVLLSFTVSAQGLWKQLLTYNSFGKTAILMVHASEAGDQAESKVTKNEAPAPGRMTNFSIEPAKDKTLEVEAWMTDDFYFGAYKYFFDVERDKPLELGSWMTDDNYFSSRFATGKDKELKVESWMIDDRYWRY